MTYTIHLHYTFYETRKMLHHLLIKDNKGAISVIQLSVRAYPLFRRKLVYIIVYISCIIATKMFLFDNFVYSST